MSNRVLDYLHIITEGYYSAKGMIGIQEITLSDEAFTELEFELGGPTSISWTGSQPSMKLMVGPSTLNVIRGS